MVTRTTSHHMMRWWLGLLLWRLGLLWLLLKMQPPQLWLIVYHVSYSCCFTYNSYLVIIKHYQLTIGIVVLQKWRNWDTEKLSNLRKCHNMSVAKPGFKFRTNSTQDALNCYCGIRLYSHHLLLLIQTFVWAQIQTEATDPVGLRQIVKSNRR